VKGPLKFMQSSPSKRYVIPYTVIGDRWTISDPIMAGIWNEAEKANLHKHVFPIWVQDPESFTGWCKSGKQLVHTIWNDQQQIESLAWLTDIGINSAWAHHACFPCVWGGNKSVDTMLESFRYWFDFKDKDGESMFDVLMGMTPSYNRLAVKFAKRVGCTILGELPAIRSIEGREVDRAGAVISYMTREAFNGRKIEQ
jgi:hypothetical protein